MFFKALNGTPLFHPGGFAEANARVTYSLKITYFEIGSSIISRIWE